MKEVFPVELTISPS